MAISPENEIDRQSETESKEGKSLGKEVHRQGRSEEGVPNLQDVSFLIPWRLLKLIFFAGNLIDLD